MATTPGTAVPGTNVPASSLVSTGGSQGIQGLAGAQGATGPTKVSGDAGNIAMLGSDGLLLVPQQSINQSIWNMRLRSFSAIGNPSFEVDQKNVGVQGPLAAGTASRWMDRWQGYKILATGVLGFGQQPSPPANILVPGTNFRISQSCAVIYVSTQQATLAAGELIQIQQAVEGPLLRELISDVHSISVLAYCTQPLSFTVNISSLTGTLYSLTKLCTISTANQWTLFSLPNLPLWAPSGTWPLTPGSTGYLLRIGLGCGSTYLSPANDTWQAGNFVCGPGTTNFASLPVNTAFYLGFVQHEPGPQCTQLIDKPFTQNYDECLRYFCKSYPYATAIGTTVGLGDISGITFANMNATTPVRFPKIMAKAPTVTGYSNATGAVNTFRDITANVDKTIQSVATVGDAGFNWFVVATPNAANWGWSGHYTADTGW